MSASKLWRNLSPLLLPKPVYESESKHDFLELLHRDYLAGHLDWLCKWRDPGPGLLSDHFSSQYSILNWTHTPFQDFHLDRIFFNKWTLKCFAISYWGVSESPISIQCNGTHNCIRSDDLANISFLSSDCNRQWYGSQPDLCERKKQ